MAQVVECVAFEAVPHCVSTSVNEIGGVSALSSHNGSVSIFQKDNIQLDSIEESCSENSTDNILNIVLPLVNENVPLYNELETIEHNPFLQKDSCVSSNNLVQYSEKQCLDKLVGTNKNVTNRNNSLPEDSELNRFSSTFENIKTLLKEGLVDGLDEMPPDFLPPNPPLMYRVSSLPNLLSHDSTKNHHSCSYLTMCATKHELLLNKLCKNIVAKHDMSVQVSTELFKNQTEKVLVDTSCQTEDIFMNIHVNNNDVSTQESDHNVCHTNKECFDIKQEMKTNEKNEMKTNEDDYPSIGYTNINVFNHECELETRLVEDCSSIGYTNINGFDEKHEIKVNEVEDYTSVPYTNISVFSQEHEINANVEEGTSYININVFKKEHELKTHVEENFCTNISYTKINTFDKEHEIKPKNEQCVDIDYTNMNVFDNGNEVCNNDIDHSNTSYTNINSFDKDLSTNTDGEDSVDIGYTNFSLYDKGLELNSNENCENYANANILEEFVNEQLSLNNADGDFDSFLFGPLPPSPVEEIGTILKKLHN